MSSNSKLFDDIKKSDLAIAVTPTLRLAVKYDMEAVRVRLVKLVVDQWPRSNTVAGWHKWQEDAHTTWSDEGTGWAFYESVPEPVSAIFFAREFGCAEIIPLAFYLLSAIDITTCDWDCDSNTDDVSKYRARWRLLDADSWRVSYHGRALIQEHGENLRLEIASSIRTMNKSCPSTNSRDCVAGAKKTLTAAFGWRGESDMDPLFSTKIWKDSSALKKLCSWCNMLVGMFLEHEQENLWNALPRMFSVT